VLDTSTSTNILKVLGNSDDTVNASGFVKALGAETEGSITYDVYTHSVKKIIFLMLFFIFKEDKPNSIFLPEDYNGVIIHWLILDL
jgi:hypothetical protein